MELLAKKVPIFSRKPITEKYYARMYIIQGHLHSIEVNYSLVQNMAGHETIFSSKIQSVYIFF